MPKYACSEAGEVYASCDDADRCRDREGKEGGEGTVAEQRVARWTAVVGIVGFVVGCILGLLVGVLAARARSPGRVDDEYTALRNQILRLLPHRERMKLRKHAGKLSAGWPATQNHIYRLINEPAPQLQLVGLFALSDHISEADPAVLQEARKLCDSRVMMVRVAAIGCLPLDERVVALTGEVDRILGDSVPHVGRRRARSSEELMDIVDMLDEFPGQERNDVVCRVAATGDTLALSDRAIEYMNTGADRRTLKYLVPYLSGLHSRQGNEFQYALFWFQHHSGIRLPRYFAIADSRWQEEALFAMAKWLRENSDVTDPSKPLPPLVLPEDPYKDVDRRHR